MHYVYLLKSIKHNFFYVGNTDDLERRLIEHNSGKELSTKSYVPFKMVYYEAYRSKTDALIRKNRLKHHGSVIGHLKRRIKYSLTE